MNRNERSVYTVDSVSSHANNGIYKPNILPKAQKKMNEKVACQAE